MRKADFKTVFRNCDGPMVIVVWNLVVSFFDWSPGMRIDLVRCYYRALVLSLFMDAKRRADILDRYGAILESNPYSVGRLRDLPFEKQIIQQIGRAHV